ncbi:MAG: helix-turn-helix transcriptional regulator [Pirellulaceae bacterium]|nr:helix-turn-helix transcriptional regulator [Pirellulaceae bacterium]
MATQQTITIEGKAYVLLPRDEYERLTILAKAAVLPALPEADAKGNYPAVEYATASLARKIIRDRAAAGLTQRKLAELAGISFENLCRIETGKQVPSVPTIEKIDRAIKDVMKKAGKSAKPTKLKAKGAAPKSTR